MRIKYLGGRVHYEVNLDRKSYYFTKENNRTLDIEDKRVINYIFSLSNSAEFEVVIEPEEIKFNPENNTVSTSDVITVELKSTKKNKYKKGRN